MSTDVIVRYSSASASGGKVMYLDQPSVLTDSLCVG